MLTKLTRPLSRSLVPAETFSRSRYQSSSNRNLSRAFFSQHQYGRSEKQRFGYEHNQHFEVVHSSSYALYLAALVGVTVGGIAYYLDWKKSPEEAKWDAVRASIAQLLESNPNYDDGSYGPLFVRLAWHASGTFDTKDGTGGSNGATMRFSPEGKWGANAGLDTARQLLEPIKKKFPDVSYADLWTLAGVVAIEQMNGPKIPWRPGRSDAATEKSIKPLTDGRLPDAGKGAPHLRDIFYRMGLNDKEIVALAGAHALGRCHTDRSGYSGPWTRSPTVFTNMFFVELLNNKWTKKKWSGPEQYEDPSGELMMLPADLALIADPGFRKYVELYAADEDLFFKDFAAAFSKLLELGVPFKK